MPKGIIESIKANYLSTETIEGNSIMAAEKISQLKSQI